MASLPPDEPSQSVTPLLTALPLIFNNTKTTGITPVPAASLRRRVVVDSHATKIEQLVGDYDKQISQPTNNQTWSRYKLAATDLGVPFTHKERTYFLFGDTDGVNGGDAIAYTTDRDPQRGLNLQFIQNVRGEYQPIIIPGIQQGEYEVPTEGISVGGGMYVYHTTDALTTPIPLMGRSIVAVSMNDGAIFKFLYDLSRLYFINVSVERVDAASLEGLPAREGGGLMMFGSGRYRQSNVYLAYQPESGIDSPNTIEYWAGLNSSTQPIWSKREQDARALFEQPCVGEFSVSYNRFIEKWLMLYNCEMPSLRGINLRSADTPWGPWSEPELIFRPWEDKGYCYFLHVSWLAMRCDTLQTAGQDNVWGGEYGPYQLKDMATGDKTSATIFFTMSTWNPYTVVLMKARLRLVLD